MTSEMRRHLVRERGDKLRRAINREIQITEAGSGVTQPEEDAYGTTDSFYTGTRSGRNRTILKTTLPDSNNRKTAPHCAFCGEIHCTIDCQKFPDLDSRMDIVKQNKL